MRWFPILNDAIFCSVFFNFLASTFPQLASCCFEFFLHFFSYDFSFIFCIHLSPTVILFNKEKLSMISSFSFNFFLSSFFCIYLSPIGLMLNIEKQSMISSFLFNRPLPAFGRQGLDADTRDDSPRACGARLGGGIEWGAPTDLLSNWPLGPNWPFGPNDSHRACGARLGRRASSPIADQLTHLCIFYTDIHI